MYNKDIREAAATSKIKLWQIADRLGISDGNFSRKLRKELPPGGYRADSADYWRACKGGMTDAKATAKK